MNPWQKPTCSSRSEERSGRLPVRGRTQTGSPTLQETQKTTCLRQWRDGLPPSPRRYGGTSRAVRRSLTSGSLLFAFILLHSSLILSSASAASMLLSDLVSYWTLDGNSTDSVGSNNGTDTDVTYTSFDFRSFTTVDLLQDTITPANRFTLTGNKIAFTGLRTDDDCAVYKDMGAGYFSGDFTHSFTMNLTTMQTYGVAWFWGLSDTLAPLPWYWSGDNNVALTMGNGNGNSPCIRLQEYCGGSGNENKWLDTDSTPRNLIQIIISP